MATSNDLTQLAVRVSPSARTSAFAGWTADEKGRPVLLVKLAAPPVDGKANTELIRFLAESLDCPKSQITLIRGTSSRQKTLELPASLLERLPK
ncbi:DUF167 domain-containing protein [Prosthecobacter sp.]|uniref:DUF167 domain-containing protein n=1 Tax=Prosthecobacter sp. TaxID=1965333 RepID=UPI002488D6FD|nr:DUF167 domain-containing protein [Prosthecobacter sp.]MDI1312502.1 DUF167 domain-containing protein [Prosthecobacter sp.]